MTNNENLYSSLRKPKSTPSTLTHTHAVRSTIAVRHTQFAVFVYENSLVSFFAFFFLVFVLFSFLFSAMHSAHETESKVKYEI